MSKYSLDNPNLEVCLICTNYRFLEIIPNLEVCLICTNYRFPELGFNAAQKLSKTQPSKDSALQGRRPNVNDLFVNLAWPDTDKAKSVVLTGRGVIEWQ